MLNIIPSKNDVKKGITLPSSLTRELAELCGVHVGDGHLGFRANKNEYLVQCTGNLHNDVPYYEQNLKALWKKTFGIDVKINQRKDNTCEIRVYSKSIALFYNQFLGLPFGKKSRTISIPSLIKNTCKESKVSPLMVSFLRGLIDTDFYLVLDRTSLELGAWFASEELVKDLYHYFNLLGMNPRIRVNVRYFNKSSGKYLLRHQIRIRRKQDVKLWFDMVGTSNPKIYKRYTDFTTRCPGGVDNHVDD